MITRSYLELSRLNTFSERFEYLKLDGNVGESTFGFERYINQSFYKSKEWRDIRQKVIARDLGRDLGVEGFDIHDRIIVHHMNPIRPIDLNEDELYSAIVDLNSLISVSHNTHNAIHYGDDSLLPKPYIPRSPGDTLLW